MNNYDLSGKLRMRFPHSEYYRKLAGIIEKAQVDIVASYRKKGRLPFNGLSKLTYNILEGIIEEEDADPNTCLLMAA